MPRFSQSGLLGAYVAGSRNNTIVDCRDCARTVTLIPERKRRKSALIGTRWKGRRFNSARRYEAHLTRRSASSRPGLFLKKTTALAAPFRSKQRRTIARYRTANANVCVCVCVRVRGIPLFTENILFPILIRATRAWKRGENVRARRYTRDMIARERSFVRARARAHIVRTVVVV